MKLSELRERQTDRQPHSEVNQQLGTIRNSTAYPKPIDGLYQGQPVRVIATGDITGMSPAVQIVDEHGKIDWVSADDVQITQRRFLPASNRAEIRNRGTRSVTPGQRQFSNSDR